MISQLDAKKWTSINYFLLNFHHTIFWCSLYLVPLTSTSQVILWEVYIVQGHLYFFFFVKVVKFSCITQFHRTKYSIWRQYRWIKIKVIFMFKMHSFYHSSVCTHLLHNLNEKVWKKYTLLFNSLTEWSPLWRNIEIANSSHYCLLKSTVNWIRDCKPSRE